MTYPVVELEGPKPSQARAVRLLGTLTGLLLALSVVGLVTVDSGAGGSKPSHSSLAAVMAAADKTTTATSAQLSMTMDISMKGMGAGTQTALMEGAMEFAGEKKFVLNMTVVGKRLEAVGHGNTIYMKLPAGARLGRVRTPWVSIEAPDTSSNPLSALGGPSIAGGGNPTATLQYLQIEGLVASAEQIDGREVRGTDTSGYRVKLDTGRFEQIMSEQLDSQAAQGGLGQLAGDAKITVREAVMDLYVDDAGLVRRQTFDVVIGISAMGQTIDMSMKTAAEMFDFGTVVDAPLPPPDQVTAVSSQVELTQLLMGTG